jgi:predicted Zn-dependent protease
MSQSTRTSIGSILLLTLPFLAGCATNPVTGKSEISLVTPAQEIEIGRQGYAPVIAEYGLYDDAALSAFVNATGQKVARVSHLPDLEWHFTVLDDPTVNAFAMPGGYIYITRGLLAYLNSEAQLAGVLGHEIGHVTHRHSAAQMTQQQLYGAGLALGSIVSPTFARYSGVAEQALGLLFLKYSRTDESQADELGVEYATKAGYDSRDIPATYAMLKRIGDQSGQSLPSFLETHPDPGQREAVTTELARTATAGKTGLLILHNEYLGHVNGILFGQDPRQGYFDGDTYFHPALSFQIRFPAGWAHQDSHASVAAGTANQSAVVQLSSASAAATMAPEAFVSQLKGNGSITGATGAREDIGGYAAWVGRLSLPAANGQAAGVLAAAFIRKGDVLYQILGRSQQQGDAEEQQIFTTMRSFRGLSDPARMNVAPDHVQVHTADASDTFGNLMKRLGATTADLETDAILNNFQVSERVQAGTLLKVIARGR